MQADGRRGARCASWTTLTLREPFEKAGPTIAVTACEKAGAELRTAGEKLR